MDTKTLTGFISLCKISLLCMTFIETKSKNEIFSNMVVWNEKWFCFLFIASRALLQRYAEFNRLLEKDFLTCYSNSYYSFMV